VGHVRFGSEDIIATRREERCGYDAQINDEVVEAMHCKKYVTISGLASMSLSYGEDLPSSARVGGVIVNTHGWRSDGNPMQHVAPLID
jgi:hypothetical protein